MNSFGRKFRVSIFGESHGPVIGVVADGVPPRIELNAEDFCEDIARRSPGAKGTTSRHEEDLPEIVSGVYDGLTTGAPLTIIFRNTNTRSSDYSEFIAKPRPGHADYTAAIKWCRANDPRGGGHFSGRVTLAVVAAGVIAKKIINCRAEGVTRISACLEEIGGKRRKSQWDALLSETAREGDSLGGVISCSVEGPLIGLGEPFWDSVESLISHAIFAIPGVRGIEFGDGFKASRMKGSEHNDPFGPDGPEKNGAGGVNGGLTSGADICFRVAIKPTSSIAKPQETFNFGSGQMETLEIKGRHDVCFALRTPVIVEAMTAIVLADLMLTY